MAKICPNCSLKHKNASTVCAKCGTPLKSSKVKKSIPFILTIVTICVILSLLFYFGYNLFFGPCAKAISVMNAADKGDSTALIRILPDFLFESENYDEKIIKSHISSFSNSLKDRIRFFYPEHPQTASTAQRTGIIKSLKDIVGESFDTDSIENMKTVWVYVREGTSDYWEGYWIKLTIIKYNGEWCWWPYY